MSKTYLVSTMPNNKIARNSSLNFGRGRPRGARNLVTRAAKEAFEVAFTQLGSVDALVSWARDNPTEYYKLYAKLIPVEQRYPGKNVEPTAINVTFVPPLGEYKG